jgi:monomeric sarcosine oxidase
VAHYDVIVIGGGTMGTAAAWELAKQGLKGLVLEQLQHVHDRGAHSGETRIIRHAYAEGADYVPLVLRADELWTELEQWTGTHILHRVGSIEFSAPGTSHVEQARQSAIVHGIPYDHLDVNDVRSRFPQFAVGDDWIAGYGPRGGFLDVEMAMRGMAAEARAGGIEIRENAPATSWEVIDGVATVTAGHGVDTADRLIITAGAWTSRLLADAGLPLTVLRKTLFWLEVDDPARFQPDGTPVYIAELPGYEFYGFPVWGQAGVKVALHNGGIATDPDSVDREVTAAERDEIIEVASQVIRGLTGRVLNATTCLYTITPDHNFVVDRLPGYDTVVVGAGFSGHGFKFAPALGELLVQLALGERETLELFALNRFQLVR